MKDKQINYGLNAKGFSKYGLSREQVLDPNSVRNTLFTTDNQNTRNSISHDRISFSTEDELDHHQGRGVLEYGLTLDQVLSPNFGEHTLRAIDDLMDKDPNLDIKAAFDKVSGLDLTQTKGVLEYKLDRKQARIPYFGYHTLIAMDNLKRNNCNLNNQSAFAMVKNLDANKARGVSEYGLTRKQVQEPNFGEHTLEGIDDLKGSKNLNMDDHDYNEKQDKQVNQKVFEEIRGLDRIQVRGVVLFGLTREQVKNKAYNEHVFKVMDMIHNAIPDMEISTLYNTVKYFDMDRVRFFLEIELNQEEIRSIVLDEDTPQQDLNSTAENVFEGKNEFASREKDLKMLAEIGSSMGGSSTSNEEKPASFRLNKNRRRNRNKMGGL